MANNTQTKFDYTTFTNLYTELKKLIGDISDTSNDTIGGVVNSANNQISRDLEYAEGAAWASSKLNDWNEAYKGLQAGFGNLVNMLDVAKATCDRYQAFEQANQNLK